MKSAPFSGLREMKLFVVRQRIGVYQSIEQTVCRYSCAVFVCGSTTLDT